MTLDAVVIGGGPAGSAVARLLASWGHRVVVITRASDRSRGLAESLPPSTHKLLEEIGIRDAVERAGFYRSTGNTVWWASSEPRVEPFASPGYQVFRPDLDRVLLDAARDAGADVQVSSFKSQLSIRDARIVLDCSGRSGVIGRKHRVQQPEHRTVAMIGVWQREDAWDLPDPTHTVVETFDRGWGWSIPTCPAIRHVAVMVDDVARDGSSLEAAYRRELDETAALHRIVRGAALQHVFACDASLYRSERYAGDGVFLVGDAGSFIDPLSSFGVKKALASAWIAAVAAHTCLIDPDRTGTAVEFFDAWERRVYHEHLRRSRDFARSAAAAHPHPFWTARAAVDVPEEAEADGGELRDAFERIRAASAIEFVLDAGARFEPQPVIRGHEIVMEAALARGAAGAAIRYARDVDLVRLADIACRYRSVPDVYDAYCRALPGAPLDNILSGLSLLVAKGILHAKT